MNLRVCAIQAWKRVVAGLGRLWAYVRVCAHGWRFYGGSGKGTMLW